MQSFVHSQVHHPHPPTTTTTTTNVREVKYFNRHFNRHQQTIPGVLEVHSTTIDSGIHLQTQPSFLTN